MRVNIIGDYFGQTGYAIHTKNLALALNKLTPVTVTTNKFPNWVSVCNDEEYRMLSSNPDECDINIMIGLPPYWSHTYNKNKPFVGFLVWEGNRIPKYWYKDLSNENVKQIWVPSQHVRTAIRNTITEFNGFEKVLDKIRVVPHGVNNLLFKTDETKKQKPFTFIANKGWRGGWLDRGGLAFLFKAFNEEFTKNENVELIVKINSAYAQINLEQEMNNLKLLPDRAPIKITPENLPYEALPNLYNAGHVFVSPTMGEAFSLPCLEAMSCGIPVITSNFGGQTDFVNNSNGWLLEEGEMFEVTHDIMYEGIRWYKPSIKELRRVLRHVYTNKDEVRVKSEVSLKDSSKWTWNNSASIALKCLTEI